MTKLIIFSKHFYPDNFKINIIAKELAKKGYDINVITSNPQYNNKNFSFINIFLNYLSHIVSCFFYCHFLLKKKYDLIFVFGTSPIFQSIPAIYFSFLIKKPIILWIQDLWPESLKDTGYIKNKYILRIIKFLVKINYLLSDVLLVQSNNFKKKIKNDFKINKKIITHYNLSELKFQKFNKYKNKKIIVTYSGNFGNAQDFETLLRVSKFSEIIKNYISKNKLSENVHLYKYIKGEKLNKILFNSDALFLTLNRGEALDNTIPGKFQTYLSFGKPIISNSVGASKNIILNSGIGLSNNPGDYRKLYSNLIKLKKMSLSKKKNIYIKSKKLYMKHFEINKNITNLISILNKTKKNDT